MLKSNNHFFSVLIRNNKSQEHKTLIVRRADSLDAASTAALQRAKRPPIGWTDCTVLSVAERLMGSSQPELDS